MCSDQIVGIRVDAIASIDVVIGSLRAAIEAKRGRLMAFANPATAILAARKHKFRDALKIFDMVASARAGLRVGTALTEGTTNFLVNRRMNKSQQMRWSRRGADLLLQVRCAVYNGTTLGSDFGQKFRPANDPSPPPAFAGVTPNLAVVPAVDTAPTSDLPSMNMDTGFRRRSSRPPILISSPKCVTSSGCIWPHPCTP
jgi:hypothetical protein